MSDVPSDAPQAPEPATLLTRVSILEAALESIQRECERAIDEPSLLFMTMCRVAALTRRAREAEGMSAAL